MGGAPSRRKSLSNQKETYLVKSAPQIQVPPPERSLSKQWFNLKGQEFEESADRWYNLSTSRYVKNKPKYDPVLSIRGIRIIGTMENLIEFWRINVSRLGQSLPKGTNFEDVIFTPFEDITFLSEDASQRSEMCFLGMAGTVIPPAQTTNVAELPLELIDKMCRFSFAGLFVKGRSVYVVDGDTLDVIIFVPLVVLGSARAIGKNTQVGILPTPGFEKTGFFAKIRIRMYGFDSAEKNTEAGQLAKRLFEEKLQSLGGIVWCQFIETTIAEEKYDRILAVLYEDEKKTRLLNDYLLKQEAAVGVKMVFPYLGGTKKKFD